MTDPISPESPKNRVVASFEDADQADAARQAVLERGVDPEMVRCFQGTDEADVLETSKSWFADTAEELARYQQELRAGRAVLAFPVDSQQQREELHSILQQHDVRLVTHFGDWLIETTG